MRTLGVRCVSSARERSCGSSSARAKWASPCASRHIGLTCRGRVARGLGSPSYFLTSLRLRFFVRAVGWAEPPSTSSGQALAKPDASRVIVGQRSAFARPTCGVILSAHYAIPTCVDSRGHLFLYGCDERT